MRIQIHNPVKIYILKKSNIPALVVLFSGCCPLGLHGFPVDGVGAGRLNKRKKYQTADSDTTA
jgi:hypothetical protein